MHDGDSVQLKFRTGKTASIWLAFLAALCVHIVVILLPLSEAPVVSEPTPALIEVELTAFRETPEPVVTEVEPESVEPETIAELEPLPEIEPEPVEQIVKQVPEPQPLELQPAPLTPAPPVRDPDRSLDTLSEPEMSKLTNAILTRQFITEETVADEIFGRPVPAESTERQEGFHYPVRQSMITMLDSPMPEVPFAYEPGLVHFAYDPGVKGDLQRFWDVITPEFGFKTKYGTEVRCRWVLIIVGCAF